MTDASSTVDGERERLARVALGHLAEPGDRDLAILVRRVGAAESLRRLVRGRVPARLRDVATARLGPTDPYELAVRAVRKAERVGARIITPADDEWPAGLSDLPRLSRDGSDAIQRDTHPPHCLWLRGPLSLAEACRQSVAVVGARASTAYGNHVATELGFGLAEREWTVVSGGAFGIDAAAHRGALASTGHTVAVLACGVDRAYPLAHQAMFERIAETGLLLSEWPPGSDPHRHRFLVRNRVIAALTRGTVMVEANLRSGARFTLRRSRDLGRVTMALPGPVTSALSRGCHEELREPETILVTGVAQILEAVGRIGLDLAPVPRAPDSPRDRLSTLERQVLDGVRPRKLLTAEEIAVAVGVSARDARRALPALETARFVTATGGGYRLYRKSDARPS